MRLKLVGTVALSSRAEVRSLTGDLTLAETDAIVNAANKHLRHGAGVAGAIVRRGGAVIQEESDEWVRVNGPITHNRPALTSAGNLSCRAVIHAVGPRWGEGDELRKLESTILAALELASSHGFQNIAFPAISTGIFGFPMDRAAGVMLEAVEGFFAEDPGSSLQQVDIVLFDSNATAVFDNAMRKRWAELYTNK